MGVFDYSRRKTLTVNVGGTPLGSKYPIRLQSMASTSTMDTDGSVEQACRISNAGAHYIRFTTQGIREVENLHKIKEKLRQQGINTPLVADIHFNPKVAFVAATVVEKVRINPGNFVDSARTFRKITYTNEEYAAETRKIEEAMIPFLELCRKHNTAIRIGVNHGSLSDRIMNRYGDTPVGMVESAMEFLRVCVAHNFFDVVVSIKASNTVIMVETVRRLVKAMDSESMQFPLHIGVTEAGDGEDGRIKSAVGIGTLLAEGIGDTIRVSLSEEPENEIPVAAVLANYISQRANAPQIEGCYAPGYCHEAPQRMKSIAINNIGGNCLPVVIVNGFSVDYPNGCMPDYFYVETTTSIPKSISTDRIIIPCDSGFDNKGFCRYFKWEQRSQIEKIEAPLKFVEVDASTPINEIIEIANSVATIVIVLGSRHINAPAQIQAVAHAMAQYGVKAPIITHCNYVNVSADDVTIMAAADFGTMLLNGLRDGIWLNSDRLTSNSQARLSFGILQAARLRLSHTEFISCPGCGRTLFDLQSTIKSVKSATSHLKGLKIGVMGCIVNGPGEMADADYGYVGAAAGHISLYKGRTCIEKNIPITESIPKLIALIKASGDWVEPTKYA